MDTAATNRVMYVVDDHAYVRRALKRLIESRGMRAEAFASPQELLEYDSCERAGCLLLDVQLPGMNGFELYEELVAAGRGAPVVFITAQCDTRARARAARLDAVACLEKPFDDDSLFSAIERALCIRM